MEGVLSAAKGGGEGGSSGGGETTVSAEHAQLQRKFENIHSTYRSLKEAEASQREEVAALTARLAEAEAGPGGELQAVCAERDNLQRRLDNVRETHKETAKEEAARREELASYQTLLNEAEKERELSVKSARAEADKEIEDLKRRLENVRETNRSVKDGERAQREEVDSLHKQLVDARIQREDLLAAAKAAAEAEIASLKEQLAKQSAQRPEAGHELETLKREHEAVVEAEQNSRERAVRLEAEAGALKVKVRKLSESIGEASERPAVHEEKQASLMRRIDELVSEKRAQAEGMVGDAETIKALKAQALEQEAAMVELAKKGSSEEREGAAASRALEEATRALKASKKELHQLRSEHQETRAKVKAAGERSVLDQKKLEQMTAQFKEATHALKASKDELQELRSERKEARSKVKAAGERSTLDQKKLEQLTAQLEAARGKEGQGAKERAAEADAALEEIKAAKSELKEKEKELKLAMRELEGVSEELVGAKVEAKSAAELSARDAETLRALEGELEAQRVSFAELTKERATVAEAGAVVTDELKAAAVELEGRTRELNHKAGKLRSATRELNEMGAVLAKAETELGEGEARATLGAERMAALELQLEDERTSMIRVREEGDRSIALKERESKELREELDAQDKRWNTAVERLAKLEEQLLAKAALEGQLNEQGALELQLAKQAEQIAGLSDEKSSSEENGAAAALMIAQLEEELTAERAKTQALEQARSQQEQRSEHGVKTITLLERELDSKRELLSGLEAELAALRETEVPSIDALPEPSIFSEALSTRATLLA